MQKINKQFDGLYTFFLQTKSGAKSAVRNFRFISISLETFFRAKYFSRKTSRGISALRFQERYIDVVQNVLVSLAYL